MKKDDRRDGLRSRTCCRWSAHCRDSSRRDGPRYQNGNHLVRPADYREWPFLGAGLGLTYDAEPGPGGQNRRRTSRTCS